MDLSLDRRTSQRAGWHFSSFSKRMGNWMDRSHSPPSTMTTFHAFLLYKYPLKSYTCLQSYKVEAPDKDPIEHLKKNALERINSHSSFQGFELLRVTGPEIYLVRRLCGAQVSRIHHGFCSVSRKSRGGRCCKSGNRWLTPLTVATWSRIVSHSFRRMILSKRQRIVIS